jgi:hypothetical protein
MVELCLLCLKIMLALRWFTHCRSMKSECTSDNICYPEVLRRFPRMTVESHMYHECEQCMFRKYFNHM